MTTLVDTIYLWLLLRRGGNPAVQQTNNLVCVLFSVTCRESCIQTAPGRLLLLRR